MNRSEFQQLQPHEKSAYLKDAELLEENNKALEGRLRQRVLPYWVGLAVVTTALVGIVGAFLTYPLYSVWQQGLAGQAELKRAEQNRQVVVQEAQAKMDAATHLAAAEVARARGVSEANEIIAEGLGGPEGYLRWLWIEGLSNTQGQVIYVPTEAGLPVLEAGKR